MTTDDLKKTLAGVMKGEVSDDATILKGASRDTSIFTRMPELVVYPKDAEDVSVMVKEISRARKAGAAVSLAARSGGTDMTGGPLTTSVVVSYTEHMTHIREVGDDFAFTKPGAYYRDFEKETLKKNLILPS